MRYISFIILTFCSMQCFSQSELRKLLWDFVGYKMNNPQNDMGDPLEPCKYSTLKSTDTTGFFEDTPNGYLFIRDGGPPCGCYYDSHVGAYKHTAGKYLLLKNNFDFCGQRYSCKSSRNWDSILPENLNLKYFYKSGKQNAEFTSLYIEVSIPRYGRETIFTTKLIPFGNPLIYTDSLLFSNYQLYDNDDNPPQYVSYIKNVLENEKIETKQNYTNKELEDIALIIFNKMASSGISLTSLQQDIKQLYRIYTDYLSINFQTITMHWNPSSGRFEIKKIEMHKSYNNFIDFLKSENYLEGLC